MANRRDWPTLIQRLNDSRTGTMTINMGSPGSAQVTRCRLLAEWRNLNVHTVGSKLHLEVASR